MEQRESNPFREYGCDGKVFFVRASEIMKQRIKMEKIKRYRQKLRMLYVIHVENTF